MALLSICSWHKWGEFIWFPLSGLSLSIKILPHHSYRSVSGEMREWDAGLICVRLSKQSSEWQAMQLSGSETERKAIITSIISHSSTFCCQTLSLLSKWASYFHWYFLICYDGPAPTWKTKGFLFFFFPPADFKGAAAGSEHSREHWEDARALKPLSLAAPYEVPWVGDLKLLNKWLT